MAMGMVGRSGRAIRLVAPNSPIEMVKANTAPTSTARATMGRSTSRHTRQGDAPRSAAASRKQIVGDVAALRHAGEMKSYIDLLFLALVILLCIAKIVTN